MKKSLKLLNERFEEYILVVDFAAMIIVITLQVIFRKVFNNSLVWSEELGRFLFIWQIFLGASISIRDDSHMKVDVIYMLLPKFKKWIKLLSYALFLAFSAYMCVVGGKLAMTILLKQQLSPALHIPMGAVYLILPLSMFLMCLRLIERIVKTLNEKKEET